MPLQAFYSPVFELPLPASHRFPMAKYRLLHAQVASHAAAWQIELQAARALTKQELMRAHDASYVERVLLGNLSRLEIRRIGFPWSQQLVERSSRSAGATLQSARAAMVDGIAVNLAGGTHHACYDRGQGFCVFNDVAVTIRVMQASGELDSAIVIDCDVHQGNGTAQLFAEDKNVLTVSLHGAQNFPFSKIPGDIDVAMPDGATDMQYAAALREALNAIPLARADVAFYLAGADPYSEDRLGRLSLTKAGLAHRDRIVIDWCRSAGIPVAIAMAGGYAEDVNDIVDIHLYTVQYAAERRRNERTRSA